MNQEEQEQSIKQQRIEAHKFTRDMIPIVLPAATKEALRSAFSIIEKHRSKLEADTEIKLAASDLTDDQKKAITERAFGEFLEFQTKMVSVSVQNIRLVSWNLVGALTGDYFPDLINEEKKRQDAENNGNQAQDNQESVPRITVLQGEPHVDPREAVREPQGSTAE